MIAFCPVQLFKRVLPSFSYERSAKLIALQDLFMYMWLFTKIKGVDDGLYNK